MQTLPPAGEGSPFTFMIESIGMAEKSAGSVRPSFLIIPSVFEGFGGDVF